MNSNYIRVLSVFILLSISCIEIQAKTTNCRNKFRDEDFLYCTKFGMPEIGKATANIKTRFMNTHRKAEDTIEIEIGLFKDSDWDQIADNKKIACDVKK